jgi:FimH, mannose binding./Fimbrial protein.
MKKTIIIRIKLTVFFLLSMMLYSKSVLAFKCVDAANNTLNSTSGGGVANVYANLAASLLPGQNLVVDIGSSIGCWNTVPNGRDDYVTLLSGSAYAGVLANFTGRVEYYGVSSPFPLTTATNEQLFTNGTSEPWDVKLYLTPVSVASGVVIQQGTLIATLIMYQRGVDKGTINDNPASATFVWNVYANNDVVIPTGGCTIASNNVTVTLPDYPGTVNVPVSINCAQNQNLKFHLNGTTVDSANTVFINRATASAAQGVGVQLTRNNVAIPTNTDVLLPTIGTSSVDLGLSATYARTTDQVTAGNVQSIIELTFEYQ